MRKKLICELSFVVVVDMLGLMLLYDVATVIWSLSLMPRSCSACSHVVVFVSGCLFRDPRRTLPCQPARLHDPVRCELPPPSRG